MQTKGLLRSFIVGTILFFAESVSAIDFDTYHSQSYINQYMRDLAREHPELVTLETLGKSREGREISYVIVSKKPVHTVPALYFNGTHHGNETVSTEAILGLIAYLIENSETRSVDDILNHYAIYLQPLVNPDGHARQSRYDSLGRDPNRDYSYPGLDESKAFKIHEVRLVKRLLDRVSFRASASYHSGMEGVLWPWCFTDQPNPQQNLFHSLARVAAQGMGSLYFKQSNHDYKAKGEFIDYSYMKHGTLALTFEVAREPSPPVAQLAAAVRKSVSGAHAFIRTVMNLDRGRWQPGTPDRTNMDGGGPLVH